MSYQMNLFTALLRAENELDEAKARVAAGTLGSEAIAEFEAKVAAIRAL